MAAADSRAPCLLQPRMVCSRVYRSAPGHERLLSNFEGCWTDGHWQPGISNADHVPTVPASSFDSACIPSRLWSAHKPRLVGLQDSRTHAHAHIRKHRSGKMRADFVIQNWVEVLCLLKQTASVRSIFFCRQLGKRAACPSGARAVSIRAPSRDARSMCLRLRVQTTRVRAGYARRPKSSMNRSISTMPNVF